MTEQVDVVVVGGASAGYAAAVAARHVGAEKVVVLEKAPRDQVGGNCQFSLMGFRFVHQGGDDVMQFLPEAYREEHRGKASIGAYSADTFRTDLARVTQGRIDPVLADILVDDSRYAIEWLTELGHRWQFFHGGAVIDGVRHYNPGTVLAPAGGGMGLIERWLRIGEELDIELRTDSRVSGLLGDSRHCHGVVVDGPDGRYELEASAVILASGGFQASAERRARYLPANADLMKVRGSRHNTGEVLDLAVGLGAATSGQWQGAHASPIDAGAPDAEMDNAVNRYGYPFGISVNSDGVRFFDEGERHRTYTYAKTGWAVLRQPGGLAHQIYDQHALAYVPEVYRTATRTEADSIGELATKLGIQPEVLERTIAEFNASITDEVPFDPTVEDGHGTTGLVPRKTNWARPITEPPFVATTVTGGITFSFGGVRIDRSARVLATSGEPITGLFANGDIVGLYYHNYPSCSGMTRNVVFGSRAGAAAAELCS